MKTTNKSALMLSMLCAAPVIAAEKPNLLFIVTDEHNFRTLGCYRDLLPEEQAEMWGKGNIVETPNLDRIADNGAIFSRMYGSSPVSTPARTAMFSGYYGFQMGMPNNSSKPGDGKYLRAEVPTIATMLTDEGYKCGYVGKIHLAEKSKPDEFWEPYPIGHKDYHYGFDAYYRYMFNGGHGKYLGMSDEGDPYFVSMSKLKGATGAKDKYGFPLYEDNRTKNVMGTTDFLTARTLDFLEDNKNNPFYCVLSIPDPHTGDLAVGKYHDMYTSMNIEMPRTYGGVTSLPAEEIPSWQKADGKAEKLQTSVPQYFGMVKNIDDCIGMILDKLEADGILENTIIVFTSDHGDLMGEHRRMNKGTIHEASARVPFIISHGLNSKKSIIPRGIVVEQVANTTDWMPTFLSLLNVDCPELMGRDLTPILSKNGAPKGWKDVTFSVKAFSLIVEGDYKLSISPNDDKAWFNDLKTDPDELTNQVDDPKYKEVILRMGKELQAMHKKTHISPNGKPAKDYIFDTSNDKGNIKVNQTLDKLVKKCSK